MSWSAGSETRAPRVIVLTTFDIDEYAFAAVKAGAAGFLLKDVPPDDLLGAIRTVHRGEAVIAPSTTRRLIAHFAALLPDEEPPRPESLAELTEREHEVLLEVARGHSNAEIGETLFLAEATVKTHIGRILMKTGLRDRVQLVVLAYETRCGATTAATGGSGTTPVPHKTGLRADDATPLPLLALSPCSTSASDTNERGGAMAGQAGPATRTRPVREREAHGSDRTRVTGVGAGDASRRPW